jgi:hypothetical protein
VVDIEELLAIGCALPNPKVADVMLTGLNLSVPVHEDDVRSVAIEQGERDIAELSGFL